MIEDNLATVPVAKETVEKCPRSSIHYRYVIVVILVVVICVFAIHFGTDTKLSETLNFAVGLASLILAVIAIVYAFIANNSFGLTVSKLDSSATSINVQTRELERSVKSVETAVAEIPPYLKQLEANLSRTHALIESQQARPVTTTSVAPPNDAAVQQFADSIIELFFRTSSWNGLKLFYVFKLSSEKGFAFDMRQFCSIDNSMSYDYAIGYLIASSCANFFTFISDADNTKIKIMAMPVPVASRIQAAIDGRIAFVQSPIKEDFLAQFERVKAFVRTIDPSAA